LAFFIFFKKSACSFAGAVSAKMNFWKSSLKISLGQKILSKINTRIEEISRASDHL